MNKILLILLAITLLGFGGYVLLTKSTPAPAPTTQPAPVPTPKTVEKIKKQIVVSLQEQNGSSEAGTAVLTEDTGKVKVVLAMVGGPIGISQPAHIHSGSCPNVGEVKYPLTSVVNGKSETTLNVTFDDLQKLLPLAVNVHKNVNEANVYVSCGDLLF